MLCYICAYVFVSCVCEHIKHISSGRFSPPVRVTFDVLLFKYNSRRTPTMKMD